MYESTAHLDTEIRRERAELDVLLSRNSLSSINTAGAPSVDADEPGGMPRGMSGTHAAYRDRERDRGVPDRHADELAAHRRAAELEKAVRTLQRDFESACAARDDALRALSDERASKVRAARARARARASVRMRAGCDWCALCRTPSCRAVARRWRACASRSRSCTPRRTRRDAATRHQRPLWRACARTSMTCASSCISYVARMGRDASGLLDSAVCARRWRVGARVSGRGGVECMCACMHASRWMCGSACVRSCCTLRACVFACLPFCVRTCCSRAVR